jgi:hypothetical protein
MVTKILTSKNTNTDRYERNTRRYSSIDKILMLKKKNKKKKVLKLFMTGKYAMKFL